MSYFAYHRRSKPTGELLAKMLQLPHGDCPSAYAENKQLLIRWGNRVNAANDHFYDTVINSCDAISRCSDKLAASITMTNSGINVPAFDVDPYRLIEEYGYPILGRDFSHARGTDIKLILQERDLRSKKDYYSVYIPTKREYRIHVVGDEVIRIQGKFLDYPKQQVAHIRNYATGYRFRAPRLRLKSDRLEAAVAAVKSLGLDFGAVDLIVADDGLGYVLEVNTAPSCSPITLGAYAVALHRLAGLETEIDMSIVDMLDKTIEDMDSDDEVEGEELNG